MPKAGRRQAHGRDQFVILIDGRVHMQLATKTALTLASGPGAAAAGARHDLNPGGRTRMTCGGRRQICARREQSAATPVHHELIYVVIPLRRFMLRGVRDKLFQERIRPTPPGPGPSGAPRSPPRRGAPPNHGQAPFGAFPTRVSSGGTDFRHGGLPPPIPPGPRPPVWALPTRRSGGFWALVCGRPAPWCGLCPQGVLVGSGCWSVDGRRWCGLARRRAGVALPFGGGVFFGGGVLLTFLDGVTFGARVIAFGDPGPISNMYLSR
jgi:hypothetical protein